VIFEAAKKVRTTIPLLLLLLDPRSEKNKNQDPGSRIWDKHPGSATLVLTPVKKKRMESGDNPAVQEALHTEDRGLSQEDTQAFKQIGPNT
jgi:hypothetical protein